MGIELKIMAPIALEHKILSRDAIMNRITISFRSFEFLDPGH